MRIPARWLTAVLIAVSCTSILAQGTKDDSIAFARAKQLSHGINLSGWYAQTGDYTAARLNTYMTPTDFALIHSVGLDHVRLSINPEPLIAEPASGTLRPEALLRLDATVQQITSAGLAVILDIHPEDSWKRQIDTTDEGAQRFLNFWLNFARHFASTDPTLVYFEILNEPSADVYRWAGLQARLVAGIRSVAPQHTIIATGGAWGGLDDLPLTEPVRDDNVIYSFHDYEPFVFTHQGTNWMGPVRAITSDVPYPSSPEAIVPALQATFDESARIDLKRYGSDRWNKQRMEEEISIVADWGKHHHVPVYCGEFGVYRDRIDPAARARWIHDMRTTLEENNIGWDMWDYKESFGLVSKSSNGPVADPAILDALGLHAPLK